MIHRLFAAVKAATKFAIEFIEETPLRRKAASRYYISQAAAYQDLYAPRKH